MRNKSNTILLNHTIEYLSGSDRLVLSNKNGALLELWHENRNVIQAGRPLFRIRLRNQQIITSDEFDALDVFNDSLVFTNCRSCPGLSAKIAISAPGNGIFRFRMENINLSEGSQLYSYELPLITIPDDWMLLNPMSEGCLIAPEDRESDESAYMREDQLGYYPGWCSCQFTAALDKTGGIRLFARDEKCGPKRFKMIGRTQGGFVIETYAWTDKIYQGDFDFELSAFDGDWMEAARPYRDWLESTTILPEFPEYPEWITSSPIVITYCVCGEGTISPNPNCFIPYTNALPFLLNIAQKTDSRIMALPMRWDGRGPWTPPYQWPPKGGENAMRDFIKAIHEAGHLVGLYGSGANWTAYCYSTDTEYSCPDQDKLLCRRPDGTLKWHDFTPYRKSTHFCLCQPQSQDIFIEETKRIAASGVDFYQLFDQDMGGRVTECFAENHCHVPGSGPHETKAGKEFHQRIIDSLKEMGSNCIIGTEGGAAEPYIGGLRFNDLRTCPFSSVPLHEYLFHEKASDFTGNQVMQFFFNIQATPENIFYRIALGFAYGNLLTIPMRKNGEVDWGGGADWNQPGPDSQAILTMARNLNAIRKKYPQYLLHGRMVPPIPVQEIPMHSLIAKNNSSYSVPEILVTRWQAPDKTHAQILTNWTPHSIPVLMNNSSIEIPSLSALVILDTLKNEN